MAKFVTKPPIHQFNCEHGHIEASEEGIFDLDENSEIRVALSSAGYGLMPVSDDFAPEVRDNLPSVAVERIKALETELAQYKELAKLAGERADRAEAVALAFRTADAERQAREATGQQSTPAAAATPAEGDKQVGEQQPTEQPATDPKASTGATVKGRK